MAANARTTTPMTFQLSVTYSSSSWRHRATGTSRTFYRQGGCEHLVEPAVHKTEDLVVVQRDHRIAEHRQTIGGVLGGCRISAEIAPVSSRRKPASVGSMARQSRRTIVAPHRRAAMAKVSRTPGNPRGVFSERGERGSNRRCFGG